MNFEALDNDQHDDLLNIASMIDVVFILLAFFVLTAQFGSDRDIPLGHRSLTSEEGAAAADLPSNIPIHLSVQENGNVRIVIGRRLLSDNDFAGITEQLRQINLPETTVVIAPQAEVSVDHVARAIDVVLASPMNSIALAKASMP